MKNCFLKNKTCITVLTHEAYNWFLSGKKYYELRPAKGQYQVTKIVPNKKIELRKG